MTDETQQPVPSIGRPVQTTVNATVSSVPVQTSGIGKDPSVAWALADIADCVRRQGAFFDEGDHASAAAVTQQIGALHATLVSLLGG